MLIFRGVLSDHTSRSCSTQKSFGTAGHPTADRMAGMVWLLGLAVMLRLGKADVCVSDCPDGEAFPAMTFTALAATLNVDVSEITSVSGREKRMDKNEPSERQKISF